MDDRTYDVSDTALREEDSLFGSLLRKAYDWVRPHLPRKFASYTGVAVRDRRLFDRHDVRAHKLRGHELIADTVRPNDDVVDIGAGHGVFSARAAWQGSTVQVTAYEGARSMVEKARETVAFSFVSDRVTIQHAVIGDPSELFGEPEGAESISPDELPECDVLIMDCEGSERAIISEMTIQPRELIVECHPEHGAPVDLVCRLLEEEQYDAVDETGDGRPFVHAVRTEET